MTALRREQIAQGRIELIRAYEDAASDPPKADAALDVAMARFADLLDHYSTLTRGQGYADGLTEGKEQGDHCGCE